MKTILIVDNDKQILNLISKYLQSKGNVLIADSSQKALNIINNNYIDMIIIDFFLNENMTGQMIWEYAKEKNSHIKIICISGTPLYIKNIIHLEKPFSLKELNKLIE